MFHFIVWIVSNQQLLAWVQNPKPISQLDQVDALKCSTPQVSQKICNGMPDNENGLLEHCPFPDFPWYTCVSLLDSFESAADISMGIVRLSYTASVAVKPEPASAERGRPTGPFPSSRQLQYAVLGPD